jgi:hypothetical protein
MQRFSGVAALAGRVHSRRVLKRMAGKRWVERNAASRLEARPEELRWTPAEAPKTASGWMKPADVKPSDLPFNVARTRDGQMLPVYTDYRHGRTKVYTLVRKATGDRSVLAEELEKLLGVRVEERVGRLQLAGNHKQAIVQYLAGLGM